jgi:hypothetical protein
MGSDEQDFDLRELLEKSRNHWISEPYVCPLTACCTSDHPAISVAVVAPGYGIAVTEFEVRVRVLAFARKVDGGVIR